MDDDDDLITLLNEKNVEFFCCRTFSNKILKYRYNAVRILTRYVDPNVIAAWDGEMSRNMICYCTCSIDVTFEK